MKSGGGWAVIGLIVAIPIGSARAALEPIFLPVSGSLHAEARAFFTAGFGDPPAANQTDLPRDVALGANYGSFAQRAAVNLPWRLVLDVEEASFARVDLTANIAPNRLNFTGHTDAGRISSQGSGDAESRGTATVIFAVSRPVTLKGTLTSSSFYLGALATLSGAAGNVLFLGVGEGGSQAATAALAPGRYQLSYEFGSQHAAGTDGPATGSFQLTPVPIPGTLWLLGSGLAALLLAHEKRRPA